MMTRHIIVRGSTDSAVARPHAHPRTRPVLDGAHASYRRQAALATASLGWSAGEAAVAVSIPVHVGEPLLFTAKTVIDGMVIGGAPKDDKSDSLKEIVVVRDETSVVTQVAIVELATQERHDFSFYGIPAPPLYSPVNPEPRFHDNPRDPKTYLRRLKSEWRVGSEEFFSELEMPTEAILVVKFWSSTAMDPDNVGLRVLDFLETLRPASAYLLDEIIDEVHLKYMGSQEPDRIEFELYWEVGESP